MGLAGLVLIPLYGASDRLAGKYGDVVELTVIPLASAITYMAFGHNVLSSIAMATAYYLYRNPGWGILGGAMDPTGWRQTGGLLLRHLLALVLAVPFLSMNVALALLAYSIGATGLGVALSKYKNVHKDVNAFIEIIRGFLLGLCLWVAL